MAMAITNVAALSLLLVLSGHSGADVSSRRSLQPSSHAWSSRRHWNTWRSQYGNMTTAPSLDATSDSSGSVTASPTTPPESSNESNNVTTPLTTPAPPPTSPPPSPPIPVPDGPGGCRKLSACACQAEDGTYVDLTPLARTDHSPRFLDVPDAAGQYSYSWNPCYGFNEGLCQNVGLCQYVPGLANGFYNLGNQTNVDFEVSSERGLMMKYVGEAGYRVPYRLSYVTLVCDGAVEAEFTVQGEPIPGIYYFILRSRYACPQGGDTTVPMPTTPAIPTIVTVTSRPSPTPDPVYNLKTVVDLLFCLLVAAVVGVVVLLMLLVAVLAKHMTLGGSRDKDGGKKEKWPLPA